VYEELATSFSSKKSSLVIAKVDADAHKELGARFGVQGFPTIKWFGLGDKKGEPYEGDRSLEAV
jgi:protein disulfide-isomerase A6